MPRAKTVISLEEDCGADYSIKAKLLEPFLKNPPRKFISRVTKTGRPYRICSCCGEICFVDECNGETHHEDNHPHIGLSKEDQTQDSFASVIEKTLIKYEGTLGAEF